MPLANHSDPNTWCSFDELCAKLKPGQGWGYNFLGGVLHPWDFDHVRNPQNGNICNEAMTCLSRFGSFAEVSISGKGLHVITKGYVRGKQLTTTILQYWNPKDSPRFFTVTGDVVGPAFSTIKDIGNNGDLVFATAPHISAKCREELATIDPDQYAKLPAEPVTADGGLMFHCQSTGCVEYHFADVLKMLEDKHGRYPKPIYEEKKQTQSFVRQFITIERADKVKREATKWLIPEFVLLNECTAFSGDMDTRKSTTAIDIAAKGSTGRLWNKVLKTPKADVRMVQTPPFSTLYAGTEDSFASTVINRFVAAGGSLTSLGRISLDVKHEKDSPDGLIEWSSALSFDAHLNVLHDAILNFNKEAEWPVGLLINDPLIGFFGDKNFNKAQDCQVIMSGLKRLCEELHISIINLMHFNKTQGASAKEKTGGSQRLIEAHRQAWSFTLIDDTDKESNTLISPIKKNLLKVAKSYEITTVGTPVEWVENGVKQHDEVGVFKFVRFSDETAEGQLLEKASKDRSKHKEVRDGVLNALAHGAVSPGTVYSTLKDLASESTVLRVVNKLIGSKKIKKNGTGPSNTTWMLATEPHQAEFDGGRG